MIQDTWYMMIHDGNSIYSAARPKTQTRDDYIISQDTGQWEKSKCMNRAENVMIKDE